MSLYTEQPAKHLQEQKKKDQSHSLVIWISVILHFAVSLVYAN